LVQNSVTYFIDGPLFTV